MKTKTYKNYIYENIKREENYNNEEKLKEYFKTHSEELRNEIIINNMQLIFPIASAYSFPSKMSIDDLISEGTIGLIKAIKYYDFKSKFSTYATNVITNTIREAIYRNNGNESLGYGKCVTRYRQIAINEFGEGKIIFKEEIIDSILKEMIEEKSIREGSIPVVKAMIQTMGKTDSKNDIENISYEEEDTNYLDQIKFIKEHFDTLTEDLTDLDIDIIKYLYGFVDGKEHKQTDAGEVFNMSHQSIQQHKDKALTRMYRKSLRYQR